MLNPGSREPQLRPTEASRGSSTARIPHLSRFSAAQGSGRPQAACPAAWASRLLCPSSPPQPVATKKLEGHTNSRAPLDMCRPAPTGRKPIKLVRVQFLDLAPGRRRHRRRRLRAVRIREILAEANKAVEPLTVAVRPEGGLCVRVQRAAGGKAHDRRSGDREGERSQLVLAGSELRARALCDPNVSAAGAERSVAAQRETEREAHIVGP